MTYDRKHFHVTWGGPLAQSEEWSTGVRFAKLEPLTGGPDSTTDELEDVPLTLLWTPVLDWFTSGNGGSAIGSLAQLSWLKVALLDQSGHYIKDARFLSFAPVSPPITTTLTPQDCYVVSLRSDETLGEANYGRMYVPTPGWLVGQNNGLITEVQAASARGAARLMLNLLTDAFRQNVHDDYRPAIMSKKGTGTSKRVSRIGVGRVMDTQRRRRNRLNEATALITL